MLQITSTTRNRAKIHELQRLLDGVAEVRPLPHDISPEIVTATDLEEGEDCCEIARAKAIAWSCALDSDQLVVATDGGLIVPALGNAWDPTRTRRFAGENASDFDRARTLLELTAGLEGAEREIGWIEAVAIAKRGVIVASWSAKSDPGSLSDAIDSETLAGSNGFWIDALWRYPRFGNRLMRELTPEELASRQDHWSRLRAPIQEWFLHAES